MVNAILGMGNDMPQRLNAIENRLRDLSTQPILLHASTGQDGGQGLSTDKNGLHLFNPAGAEVVTLATADGSATFNGNVNINGNLAVPNGSITNAALQNPVQYGSVGPSEGGFAIDTTHRQRAIASITVPTGYSNATVMTVANVTGANSNSISGNLYVQAFAGAGVGGTTIAYGPPTNECTASASAINTFTGLSGGTIQVGCYVYCDAGTWAASSYTLANVNAIVLFSR